MKFLEWYKLDESARSIITAHLKKIDARHRTLSQPQSDAPSSITPREITNSHQGTTVKIHNPHGMYHGRIGVLTGAGTRGTSEVNFNDNTPTHHVRHEQLTLYK